MLTTSDGLLNHRITVEQPAKGFRIAIDTIFLAAAVPAQAGEKVIDLGCGVGGAMLALACRVADVSVTGIEIQHELVELCERNIARNEFSGRLNVVCDCVTKGKENGGKRTDFLSPALASFDHAMMNPPYHDETRHDVSPNASKRTANTASNDVAEWVEAAARFLKPGGTLTIIHLTDEQDKLLAALGGLFGDAHILPLLPMEGGMPKRIIVRTIKGAAGPLQTAQPLVLHKTGGGYTDAAESILRHAEALNF